MLQICQRMPKTVQPNHSGWVRDRTDFLSQPSEGNKSCWHLDLGLLVHKEWWDNNFYCLSHLVCDALLRQPNQTTHYGRGSQGFRLYHFPVLRLDTNFLVMIKQKIYVMTCLSPFCWAAITKYRTLGALNNRKFWNQEVRDLGASKVQFWWKWSSYLSDGHLLDMSSHSWEREFFDVIIFHKGTNLIMKAPILWPHLPWLSP